MRTTPTQLFGTPLLYVPKMQTSDEIKLCMKLSLWCHLRWSDSSVHTRRMDVQKAIEFISAFLVIAQYVLVKNLKRMMRKSKSLVARICANIHPGET